jgi:hypothetical protein
MRLLVTAEDLKHCAILCGSIVVNLFVVSLLCRGAEQILIHFER